MPIDYEKYYHLENYLFTEIHPKFKATGTLTSREFFCIIIWKANRAKSKIASLLLNKFSTLEEAVKIIASTLSRENSPKMRMQFLMKECGFRLPMASAILTVLFPEEFTVYDIRVCDSLGKFHSLKNKTNFDNLWEAYSQYKREVEEKAPTGYSLRKADQFHWGRAFFRQLEEDVKNKFPSKNQEKYPQEINTRSTL